LNSGIAKKKRNGISAGHWPNILRKVNDLSGVRRGLRRRLSQEKGEHEFGGGGRKRQRIPKSFAE